MTDNNEQPLKRIRVIQGPNLNLLGKRNSQHYGTLTLEELHQQLHNEAIKLNIEVLTFQSNHEGDLIDMIHLSIKDTQGLIINPAGYTHTSIAIADALEIYPHPIIEVHLSDIHNREPFRKHSYITPHATAAIIGKGPKGYLEGLNILAKSV